MSKLRSVSTAFWSDPFIEELSANEKLLFLYFITNEKTNMLGVYELSIKKISFETGIEKDVIENALKLFELNKKVKYLNNHIILLNFAKHQNYNTNMKISAIGVYNDLPKCLKINDEVIDKSNPSEGFERVLNHLGMVRKVEVEYETEIETEIEDEKENKKEIKENKTATPFSFFNSLILLGAKKELVNDWLKVRKTKKLTNTETAFNNLKIEFEKSGKPINQILEKCITESWGGFKSSWNWDNNNNKLQNNGTATFSKNR